MPHTTKVRARFLLPLALLAVSACGGDSPAEPALAHESIMGAYVGVMGGVSQGVTAALDFSLTLGQSSGDIAGSYAIAGTLSDGVQYVDVQGTGSVTGTIAAGSNPSVNLTIRSSVCPAYTARFSGAYDGTNRRLSITGPVEFFGANGCSVALSYPTTLVLTR